MRGMSEALGWSTNRGKRRVIHDDVTAPGSMDGSTTARRPVVPGVGQQPMLLVMAAAAR